MISRVSHYAVAFGLDVGVLDTGETAVIEMNDFCCLGNYGLKAQHYAMCIAKRWTEIFRTFHPTHSLAPLPTNDTIIAPKG